jgi:hypothetical protein
MTMQNAGVMAAQMIDRWSWWRQALSYPSQIGKTLLVSPSEPEVGFYRMRRKDGQWEPVGIWLDDDHQLVAFRSNRPVDPIEIWTWCLRYPISREAYVQATEGGGFDDEPPPPRGHNLAASDPLDALKQELAGEIEQASEFLQQGVASQADADRLGIWARRIADIVKRAEHQRVIEKEPHLQAGRAVDDKFRPVIDGGKEFAGKLKKALEPFLLAQKRAEEERARKAREEAEALRRAAQESEQAAELLAKADEAEKAAEAKNASAGRTGARVSIRTDRRARVKDYYAAAKALLLANNRDVMAVIDRAAQQELRAGILIPGAEIEIVEKVQ